MAGGFKLQTRPSTVEQSQNRPGNETDRGPELAAGPDGNREAQATLAQEEGTYLPGLGSGGQSLGKKQVPHQQLQQNGYVSEKLNVGVAQATHQGVA